MCARAIFFYQQLHCSQIVILKNLSGSQNWIHRFFLLFSILSLALSLLHVIFFHVVCLCHNILLTSDSIMFYHHLSGVHAINTHIHTHMHYENLLWIIRINDLCRRNYTYASQTSTLRSILQSQYDDATFPNFTF